MASTLTLKMNCEQCGERTWHDEMVETDHGLICGLCDQLPVYSDECRNALILIQRIFRKHLAAAAEPCFHCERLTLTRHAYEGGLICGDCLDEFMIARMEDEWDRACPGCGYDECRCDDDDGWCEKCEGAHGCFCAEQEEDARLARHRRVCGFPDCEGGCGTLDCGCVDKCKCEGWWATFDTWSWDPE